MLRKTVFLLSMAVYTFGIKELVFVQAIWRHGDRAPISYPYPLDPYDESYWPRGWAQLTNRGMLELRELGIFMRNRYPTTFVGVTYRPEEVKMLSSESDRALTSAQSFLSGFYKPEGFLRFDKDLEWQPIPVHSVGDGTEDALLKPTSVKCDRYDKIVNESNSVLSKEMSKDYMNLFQFLAHATGYSSFTYKEVDKVYDITRELLNNLTSKQPNWLDKEWKEYGNRKTMEIITELRREKMVSLFDTPEKAHLVAGVTLNAWIGNAVDVAGGKMTSPSRMMFYSSHDGTVMALMSAMNISNDLMMPYASALIMEIYKEDNLYTVETFYRNETTVDPHPLVIPQCGSPCSVEKLEMIFKDRRIANFEQLQKLCSLTPPHSQSGNSAHFTILLLFSLFQLVCN